MRTLPLLALENLCVCPAFSIPWVCVHSRGFFPSGKTFCSAFVTTSQVICRASSEHGACLASFHLSFGTSLAVSSKQSKNSCLFVPLVTHRTSCVRNGCSRLPTNGSARQEQTRPGAACGTTMWSIRMDLPWSEKNYFPMSCHVVATAR